MSIRRILKKRGSFSVGVPTEPTDPNTGTTQAETTAYMDTLGIPNDSTMSIYGITNSEVWGVVDSFISGLKDNGIFDRINHIFPKVGDTAVQQAVNLMNPAHSGTFYGAWVFDNTGAVGNGTDTYFDTGLIVKNIMTPQNGGLSAVARNVDSTKRDTNLMGTHSGDWVGSAWINIEWSVANSYGMAFGGQVDLAYKPSGMTQQGVWGINSINSTAKLFRNGTLYGASKDTSTWTFTPTINNYEGAVHMGGATPKPSGFLRGALGTTVYNQGLTDAEMTTLHNLISQFETGLNRPM